MSRNLGIMFHQPKFGKESELAFVIFIYELEKK